MTSSLGYGVEQSLTCDSSIDPIDTLNFNSYRCVNFEKSLTKLFVIKKVRNVVFVQKQ